MLFLHPWLLIGLIAAGIPILIHLFRQRAARPVGWAAMRFLSAAIYARHRRKEWEDLLVMAARCLFLALLALTIARPFISPDSKVPWLLVLPAGLVAIGLLAASFILGKRHWRWLVRGLAIVVLGATSGLLYWEKSLNLKRFEMNGQRDVALIIDASASMELVREGKTVFQSAVAEAKQLVQQAPRGTAFVVILGGPAPEAKTATPLTQRAAVLTILDQLTTIGGSFRAHDALAMATLSLAQGGNATKEIIVFTDSQRSGWKFDDPAAWDTLTSAWKTLPAPPKLLLRDYGTPASLQNLAITGIEIGNTLLGMDREQRIQVTVENTGTQPITSGPVELEIAGRKVAQLPLGLLIPGQKITLDFYHRFTTPGPQAVQAHLDLADDLAADNRAGCVALVRKKLIILLVDGHSTGSFFERAAGYSALALAPSSGLISGESAENSFLMEPRVVAAQSLREEDFENAAVVVLADVPRLPHSLASKLAAKVSAGMGLLVIAGPRAETAFYNQWTGADGLLLPMALGAEATDLTGISPVATGPASPSLALFPRTVDFRTTRVNRWRKTGQAVPSSVIAATYSNGDTFLATRNYGRGRSLLATCAFDARAGNLPAQPTFVPLVHEIINGLASGGVELTIDSAWSPSFPLDSSSSGLTAKYFKDDDHRQTPLHEQINPTIDFDGTQHPANSQVVTDRYSVLWTGTVTAPVSGDYQFDAEVAGEMEVEIGASGPLTAGTGQPELGTVFIAAGQQIPIEVTFTQTAEESYARLYWTPPGGKRRIIPATALTPDRAMQSTPLPATDPRGLPREAMIRSSRRGRELAISGSAMPGIYQIAVGNMLDTQVPGISQGSLPVAVRSDPGESKFEVRTAEDLTLIRKRIDLLLPQSLADIVAVLESKGFGREIWKLLALAALLIFLLESFLTRWASRSRRTAEDTHVQFGDSMVGRQVK